MSHHRKISRWAFVFIACQALCSGIVQAQEGQAFAQLSRKKAAVKAVISSSPDTDTRDVKQTLHAVMVELNKVRGIYFLLSDESIGERLVNPIQNSTGEVEKILTQVLKNTGLQYRKVNEKTFVIHLPKDGDKLTSEAHPALFLPAPQAEEQTAFAVLPPPVNITGTVVAADGSPLAGVSVLIKGSQRGTSTNAKGEFSLNAESSDVLLISYIGYLEQEFKVNDNRKFSITLTPISQQLSDVMVTTALGIQRKSKDLTYATQRLSNADLTTVKDANFINSLSGKVAGVTITRSASGLGGSARVVLRGNKSTRENQPLYVVDGIPLANFSPSQPTDVWGQASGAGSTGRDGGDGISNLNPDDIESLTILKGASGAALYGSQAANGAIVITTRSGRAGKTRISFSSDLTLETPLYYPQTQFKYGQTGLGGTGYDPTTEGSWGKVVNAPDHVKSFFQTGVTATNSISLSGGTERAQTYFSYANTSSKGNEPTSTFNKHNLNFRETAKFFNDRLTVDANIALLTQKAHNRATSGLYANPLTGLLLFPRGLDFSNYATNYQYFSPSRNMYLQNWFDINFDKGNTGQDHEQNPYWLLNKAPRDDARDRAFTNLSLKYKLNSWLNIQARGNFDKAVDTYDSRMSAGTQSVQSAPNGRYTYQRTISTQLYGDVILSAGKQLDASWNIQANLGSSIADTKVDNQSFDTDPTATSGLYYANKFGINYIMADALVADQSLAHKQQQAIFASVQLGYKGFFFVDLTGRNDWSSTFAFTPTAKTGYFYYSAGANLVLSEALKMPSAISFSKLRVSYAKVGNDVPVYITNPSLYTQNNRQGATPASKFPYPGTYLQPEDNRSFEVGTEWRFAKDRVGVDLTYYKNNNYRQYMEVAAGVGTGFSNFYLNLGNIQNKGLEAIVFAVPVLNKHLKWTSTFNLSSNKNTVVKLSDAGISGANANNPLILTGAGVNMYQSQIIEGGSWGDIYGYTFQRSPKDGSILVDGTGAPLKNNALSFVGNPNPKFSLGWNNSIDMGNFTLSALIDGRFGGKVMSVTQAVLDGLGDSKASADARDAGGVSIDATNSVTNQKWTGLIPAQVFYQGVGGRAGISECYMYDATAIRLRELAIGYKIPVHVRGISDLRLSLIGRNLFFFSRKAPFDPEVSMATNNGLQGIETFGIPSTRSIGASLKISF